MGEPFLGELKLISWNFAPKGWALCNGQFLPINQNQALFSIMGTTYGGNGQTTFALPDLRGRAAAHFGDGLTLGERAGQEFHTLTQSEMPTHTHALNAFTGSGDQPVPANNLFAAYNNGYTASAPQTALFADTVANVGGGQAHENRQPFLVLNYIVALIGIFPSRN